MSEDVQKPRRWDLDQYHVANRRRARDAGLGEDEVEGAVPAPVRPKDANCSASAADPLARLGAGPAWSGDEDGPETAGKRGILDDDGFYLEPGEEKIRPRYVEDGALFWIALAGSVLTVLTAGLYRFWLITRLRRQYAGSIRIDNDPIEYTGTGFEKMVGFLIAITVLAIYLGLANVLLLFLGIVSLDADSLLAPLSLVAVAPFLFWASYRSQRYILARLRWRGIRFGLEPGAWGYMVRSLLWSVAVIATAGFLYPYMHFRQSKYIADRSFFGSLRWQQGGSWIGLMRYWIWLYIAGGMMVLAAWGLAEEMKLGEEGIAIMVLVLSPFAGLGAFLLYMNYQVASFRYLWDNRSIGPSRLNNDVSTSSVVWAYVRGSFLVSLLTGVAISVVMLIVVGLIMGLGLGNPEQGLDILADPEAEPDLGQLIAFAPAIVGFAAVYLFAFALSYAFTQSFVIQPLLRLRVEGALIRNPRALARAEQREHDHAAEAGGFADALGLDMGAGL